VKKEQKNILTGFTLADLVGAIHGAFGLRYESCTPIIWYDQIQGPSIYNNELYNIDLLQPMLITRAQSSSASSTSGYDYSKAESLTRNVMLLRILPQLSAWDRPELTTDGSTNMSIFDASIWNFDPVLGPKVAVMETENRAGDGYKQQGDTKTYSNFSTNLKGANIAYILTAMENAYSGVTNSVRTRYSLSDIQTAYWEAKDFSIISSKEETQNGKELFKKAKSYQKFVNTNLYNYSAQLDMSQSQIVSNRSDNKYIIGPITITYPEYEDIEELTAEKLLPGSVSLRKKMDDILDRSKNMHLIKDGISTVIVGKPNVGKSSLLNALLEEDKAIVTDIAGTTRDVVEGSIRLNDIVLNMIDTAGIRETEDKIEHMGVKKSLSLIDQADLVLVVLDGSRPIEAEDKELLERTEGLNRIVLINKSDKGCVIDTEGIHISAKENHIDELIQHIKDEFDFSAITNSQAQVLANQRQVQLLDKASQSLNVAIQAMEDGIPTDLIVTDLYNSWENLKEILGEQAKEDL